ncbi:bifunctional 2',3'-cyclic-nucleotide 2'-phosphodiesterase/3'-nucleotidase [Ruegeria halocynthiae]|uniref:bifunctional 2',3'-cyclic-nucleotide 2'-phosphodiesterase/3'-nucleotidase n=1 Tax=Ruegeria halocynthiae TaxID=985054 RepID=UPI002481A761|nr:bifunctional 2',3'-cyclic-nucleotide 2'-phosphodiesterase/3'-nucleotidase [Ruegeria halocynthiae]
MIPKEFSPKKHDRRLGTQVRILATSDLHMHLTSYDYYSDRPEPTVGFTRTASLIHDARKQATRDGSLVLLFDNGDSLQGTPLGSWAAETVPDDHPLPQAFNALNYDAIGLGNHDFGFGLDLVNRIAHQTTCPMICSNMQSTEANQGWVSHAILQRTVSVNGHQIPIRIGIFSVLPPQTTRWEAHMLQNRVVVTDILTAARSTASELRRQGCDLIVALAHTGLGPSEAEPGMENAIIPLAQMTEIDAIVAGHTHLTLPDRAHDGLQFVDSDRGLVHGTPVVMQGWAGSHLGIIDLTLEQTPEDRWRVAASHVEARAIRNAEPATPECPAMKRVFARAHTATRAQIARPVGSITRPLHSYFSYCAPDRGLALIAAAQAAALRPHLAGTIWADLPILSAAAPAKFGGRAGNNYYTNIPAGEISVRHIADLSVFPNELRAVPATGSQLLDWLEMSAGLFNQLSSHGPVALANPLRTGHNFDVLHGVTCRIDLSQPPRFDPAGRLNDPSYSRIRDLNFNGRPVTPDQRFVVTLNNYRISGGGHFPISQQPELIALPPLRILDILHDYVAGALPVDPLEHAPRPFSFSRTQGVNAILTTGPGAQKYLEELAEYHPRLLPPNSDGFLRVQLTL